MPNWIQKHKSRMVELEVTASAVAKLCGWTGHKLVRNEDTTWTLHFCQQDGSESACQPRKTVDDMLYWLHVYSSGYRDGKARAEASF